MNDRCYITKEYNSEQNVKVIIESFKRILGNEKVDEDSNFFELGGHSLKAIRLINDVEKLTGTRLTYEDVFYCPTPKLLSPKIVENRVFADISRAPKKEYYLMSSVQKRMYLIHQTDDNLSYNIPLCFKLVGNIDVNRLEKSFQKIIDRNDIFRTSFHLKDGEYIQRIEESVKADFSYEEKENVCNVVSAFVQKFDLSRAPLIRMKVVKGINESLLLIDIHHIITDGTSISLFLNELSNTYNGVYLNSQPLQYKDYSEWIVKKDFSKEKKYWQEQFDQDATGLDLPFDYIKPPVQTCHGNIVEKEIPEELTNQIKRFSLEMGCTEYMVLLSAFLILLGKICLQEDVLVGTVINGRIHGDLDWIMGMFANTVILRSQIPNEKKYTDFLMDVKQKVMKLYENQDYPFEYIIEHSGLTSDQLLNAVFTMKNYETSMLNLMGVKCEEQTIYNGFSKFNLNMNVEHHENHYVFGIEYCTELFKMESVERIMSYYMDIIGQLIQNPEMRLGDCVFSEALGIDRIYKDYNATEEKFDICTLHELFIRQAQITPNKTAIICYEENITYGDLLSRSLKLAAFLKDKGVKKSDRVGILSERRIETIVNILATLMVGAAYIPLNTNDPEDRRRFVYNNSGCAFYLEGTTYLLENVDLRYPADANIVDYSTLDELAYIIYTSGSTGVPKGVMIKHRACSNTILDINNKIGLSGDDNIIGLSSYCFDLSVYDIFGSMSTGATLVIVKDQSDTKDILNILEKNSITVWNSVPAIMSLFTEDLKEQYKNIFLRSVLLSGDWIPLTLPDKIRDVFINSEVISLGGATEASIWSIYYPIKSIDSNWKSIPYGMPLANQSIYIMDRNHNLCPVGVRGYIYIGGIGVADGYDGDEEKTNKAFIMHEKYGRIYRTGDLGVMHSEGYVEFLGRCDDQVKIRGFRIELGEIQSAINKQEGIKEAIVDIKKNGYDLSLCAYIVSDDEVNTKLLKDRLRKHLPEYMIPNYIMKIRNIPMTKNGKVDRKSLPDIDNNSESEYVAPRTEEEAVLAKVISEILGCQRVSVTDNFFDIGGDSMKAMIVISKIRQCGYNIEIRDIMKAGVIEKVAKRIYK